MTPALTRAVLFDGQHPCQSVSLGDALIAKLNNQQILWVDIQGADDAALETLGLDRAQMDPHNAGPLGVARGEEWTYLHVQALNWHEGKTPRHVPVVVAVGLNRVVSLHTQPVDFIERVFANETHRLRVGKMEAMSFAASLLDRMLTDYMDGRDEFETVLDKIEMQILHRPRPEHLRKLHGMRRMACRLRHHLTHQRDLFDAMGRPDFDPDQSAETALHCRVLSARYSRVVDAIETARDLINGSFDLYATRAAEATNQAMATLTIVTVVMGVGATLAGVLGMNFETSLFHDSTDGFWVAAGGILGLTIAAIAWAMWRHSPWRRQ